MRTFRTVAAATGQNRASTISAFGPSCCVPAGSRVKHGPDTDSQTQQAEAAKRKGAQPQLQKHVDPGRGRVACVVQDLHGLAPSVAARAGGRERAGFTGKGGEFDDGIIGAAALGRSALEVDHGARRLGRGVDQTPCGGVHGAGAGEERKSEEQ